MARPAKDPAKVIDEVLDLLADALLEESRKRDPNLGPPAPKNQEPAAPEMGQRTSSIASSTLADGGDVALVVDVALARAEFA